MCWLSKPSLLTLQTRFCRLSKLFKLSKPRFVDSALDKWCHPRAVRKCSFEVDIVIITIIIIIIIIIINVIIVIVIIIIIVSFIVISIIIIIICAVIIEHT